MKMPVWFKVLVLLSIVITGILVSCDENCNPCSKSKEADAEYVLYTGREILKVHGPTNNLGVETWVTIRKQNFLLNGHDYYRLYFESGPDIGFVHSTKCHACEYERKTRDSLIISSFNEIMDTLKTIPENITKDELKSLFKTYEDNVVRRVDNLLLDTFD